MTDKDTAIRAFIAIELPEEIRQALNSVEQQIQAKAGEAGRRAVRWVAASNIHLTLKFLGEVSASNLQALTRKIREEVQQHPPFSFTIHGLGAFPNTRRPRVLWVGVEAPAELVVMQKAIEAETRRLGYPAEERPFSPHLTLGRTSQNARPEEIALLANALSGINPGVLGQVQAEEITLYRSELRPSGAVYSVLEEFPLGKKHA
jgi:RNA 2',3'-cyclic 3'-phosphodiesterase